MDCFFFFAAFFFVNVPEPGEAHTTESTHTPATQTCAEEIQTSQLSEVLSNCGGRGVCHVCVDDTRLLLLCNCGVQISAIGLTTAKSFHCCAHHRRP